MGVVPVPVEPEEPAPEVPELEEPEPVDPDPVEPVPDVLDPDEPDPDEPDPEVPEPDDPVPVEPEPVDPEPVDPVPVEPEPVEPELDEPDPEEPVPVELEPEEPEPVDVEPDEPEPDDPLPLPLELPLPELEEPLLDEPLPEPDELLPLLDEPLPELPELPELPPPSDSSPALLELPLELPVLVPVPVLDPLDDPELPVDWEEPPEEPPVVMLDGGAPWPSVRVSSILIFESTLIASLRVPALIIRAFTSDVLNVALTPSTVATIDFPSLLSATLMVLVWPVVPVQVRTPPTTLGVTVNMSRDSSASIPLNGAVGPGERRLRFLDVRSVAVVETCLDAETRNPRVRLTRAIILPLSEKSELESREHPGQPDPIPETT